MNFIKGNQNPVIGVTTFFEVVDLGVALNFTSPNNLQYVWYIYKKGKNGSWENITENDGKTGTKVPYKFGDIAIDVPFKLEVHKAVRNILTKKFDVTNFASLEIIPTSNKNYSIQKVVLFNNGAKDPNKATYKDSLIARAYCVAMFNKEVEFQLWEDDAAGKGHNPEINKNNKLPQIFKARVNTKGFAEVKISLLSNEKVLRSIADKYFSAGDKNEGANHEYYVTASYAGKIQGASQVNVNVATAGAQQPKDSAIFPGTSNQPAKPDKEGKVTHAYFLDHKGTPTQNLKVGDAFFIRIKTSNMKGENFQIIVWESDLLNPDPIFASEKLTVKEDTFTTAKINLTQDRYDKGIDFKNQNSGDPDKDSQSYYIEVRPLQSKVKSVSFGVDDESKRTIVENGISPAVVKPTTSPSTTNCGEKYCIKKGDDNELIREINIRLAGFGGNVPTSLFTDRTEKMVKQFQRDYMKVPETGKVCGNVLKAIDDFCNKWTENISNYLCLCKNENAIKNKCSGFGKGQFKGEYSKKERAEKYHKYERPGIHRSLLWGVSALKYYLSNQKIYKYYGITAGYRCWEHNTLKGRATTNHMGKAVDLQFSKNNKAITGKSQSNIPLLKEVRDQFFTKYLNSKYQWVDGTNNFSLEPFGLGSGQTWSWIHMDVREFDNENLDDKFFTKTQNKIIDKSIVQMAIELGFQNTCNCLKGFESPIKPIEEKASEKGCEDKFKKIAPIILKHEGGYVNHKSDKGGPTNKGITLVTWEKYAKGDLNIEPTLENLKVITDDQATKIYRLRYWEPKGFCKIEDERVGLMIYDWTITSGGAVKQVQKLLKNEFSQNIKDDGGMGPLTIDAINNVEDQDKLLTRLAKIRKQYYTNLTFTDGKKNDQEVFLKGWINRVDDCLKFKP